MPITDVELASKMGVKVIRWLNGIGDTIDIAKFNRLVDDVGIETVARGLDVSPREIETWQLAGSIPKRNQGDLVDWANGIKTKIEEADAPRVPSDSDMAPDLTASGKTADQYLADEAARTRAREIVADEKEMAPIVPGRDRGKTPTGGAPARTLHPEDARLLKGEREARKLEKEAEDAQAAKDNFVRGGGADEETVMGTAIREAVEEKAAGPKPELVHSQPVQADTQAGLANKSLEQVRGNVGAGPSEETLRYVRELRSQAAALKRGETRLDKAAAQDRIAFLETMISEANSGAKTVDELKDYHKAFLSGGGQ
jgi:hypothetical protein